MNVPYKIFMQNYIKLHLVSIIDWYFNIDIDAKSNRILNKELNKNAHTFHYFSNYFI